MDQQCFELRTGACENVAIDHCYMCHLEYEPQGKGLPERVETEVDRGEELGRVQYWMVVREPRDRSKLAAAEPFLRRAAAARE